MARELGALPYSERIKRYRDLAEEAQEKAAQATDPDAQRSFMLVAKGWRLLAASCNPRLC
jgi:hypothetical protein